MSSEGSDIDRDAQPTDTIPIVMAGLDLVWRTEETMSLSVLRTFLGICIAAERDGIGIPVLRLAKSLGIWRTNVTRNLKYLRRNGWIGTVKDSEDIRLDLNMPTEKGWALYDQLRQLP